MLIVRATDCAGRAPRLAALETLTDWEVPMMGFRVLGVVFRPPWLWAWLLGGGPVLVLAVLFIIDGWALAELRPPENVKTLRQFTEEMPPPDWLARIEHEGTTYLVWIGQNPDTIVPASGPPCYVFDRSGRLVDYSLGTGDDHHVEKHYWRAPESPKITLAEALQFASGSE